MADKAQRESSHTVKRKSLMSYRRPEPQHRAGRERKEATHTESLKLGWPTPMLLEPE